MEFGALPWLPTVDLFELLIVLALLVGLPAAVYNVREAWAEKEWALDDADPALRRLGENRWDNARSLLLAMLTVAVCTLSALLVPSPALLNGGPGAAIDFQDAFNAVLQRLGFLLVVVFLAHKCLNDAIWRRYVDRRRHAAGAALGAGVGPVGGVAVVEAPVVVLEHGHGYAAPAEAPAPAEGAKD